MRSDSNLPTSHALVSAAIESYVFFLFTEVNGPSAYVLDLRSIFPPSDPKNSNDASWRDFALSLERDYASLQAKYEAEQISQFCGLLLSDTLSCFP